MIEIEKQDTAAVFNLASRVAEYVSSLETVLLEESGQLEELADKIVNEEIRREDYSPIFAVMNEAERQKYEELCAEILVASQTEIIFSEKEELSATFIARVASPGIRMQELLTSVAVREKLLDEYDFVSLWAATSGHDRDAQLLEKYEAPVLACIASSAKPQL